MAVWFRCENYVFHFYVLKVSRSVDLKLKGKMQAVENYNTRQERSNLFLAFAETTRRRQQPQIEIKMLL